MIITTPTLFSAPPPAPNPRLMYTTRKRPEKESRWRVVETGHAFPIGRHGHSMSSIAGWTPPSFHPDGTLTAAELAPQSKVVSPSDKGNPRNKVQKYKRALTAAAAATAMAGRVGGGGVMNSGGGTKASAAAPTAPAKLPSEAATFQWGEKAPTCAVVFGGLNSMYVNPEVWLLPLRWVENTVQFFPPSPEPEPDRTEEGNDTINGLGGLGFATAVKLKRAAAVAATTARGRVAANAGESAGSNTGKGAAAALGGVGVGDSAWRLFQAGGAGAGKGDVVNRRASLPGGLAAGAAPLSLGPGLDLLQPYQQQQQQHEYGVEGHLVSGVGGGVAAVGRRGDDDHNGMLESAAEMEVSYGRMTLNVLLLEVIRNMSTL